MIRGDTNEIHKCPKERTPSGILLCIAPACPDKPDQCFKIVKIIIITDDPLTVIDDPCLLIASETVKQLRNTVSAGKFGKCPRFDLFRK